MTILSLILILIQVESSGNDHEDAFDRETSIDIFLAYMARYATYERLGRAVTAEDVARIHNGGPNGWKKQSTEKYWKNVQTKL